MIADESTNTKDYELLKVRKFMITEKIPKSKNNRRYVIKIKLKEFRANELSSQFKFNKCLREAIFKEFKNNKLLLLSLFNSISIRL